MYTFTLNLKGTLETPNPKPEAGSKRPRCPRRGSGTDRPPGLRHRGDFLGVAFEVLRS